ncbi:MAG: CvpA family protein [Bacteroidales bacterium]|nr:CvpA family protein [Bacteroidales bacterium]
MNYIDILLGILLLLSAIGGFKNGLIRELTSLAAWILGIFLAVKLTQILSPMITPKIIHSASIAKIVLFAITFFGVVIAVTILGKIVQAFFEDLDLGFLMKLGGAFVSVCKTAFILSLLMVILHLSIIKWNWPSEETRQKSFLYQPIESVAPAVFVYLKTLTSSDENKNP